MKKVITAALCAAMIGWAGSAMAIQYELAGSSITGPAIVNGGDGLLMRYVLSDLANKASNLDVGQSWTFDFAKFWTTETWINQDDKTSEAIYATIDFIVPNATATAGGSSVGFAGFLKFRQGWDLTWNDPVTVELLNGQSFSIDLSDGSFRTGWWQGPNGSECNSVNITATITHLSDPVPEPTTMLLFGTGLAGLAAVGRRRTATNA